jgi:uncharacterized protein (TIGR02268 family)
MPTVFLFGSEIRKKSVRVDTTRIRVVDAGEQSRTIVVQAVNPLGVGERHELEVEFADVKPPARAVFVLVAHPSDVDTLINVVRQEPAVTACPAEVRAEIRRPEDLLLLGYMGKSGVPIARIDSTTDDAQGLESTQGVAYRGKGWLMFQVGIRNMRGPQPWLSTEATLTSKTGEKLRGRVVLEQQGETPPGEAVQVLVVTEEPPESVGLVFILELSGADGRTLALPQVKIPAPAEESKR